MSVAVHHVAEGPADAPVLVLSGSLGTDHTMWEPQARALSERLRVVRYDRRGHGRSAVPPGPYTLADLGGDVLALLDRLGAERASFAGLSLGGMVGMWLAEHAPERIDRLALLCTGASFFDAATWAERAAAVREAGGPAGLAELTMERWFSERFRAEHPDVVARFRAGLASTPAEGYAACCEAIGSADLQDALGTIVAPTLVVAGEKDPSSTPEAGRALAAAIPGARLEVVAGAHLASVECAAEVTRLLAEHLSAA